MCGEQRMIIALLSVDRLNLMQKEEPQTDDFLVKYKLVSFEFLPKTGNNQGYSRCFLVVRSLSHGVPKPFGGQPQPLDCGPCPLP